MQTCAHVPFRQRSPVQALPSSQSASVPHVFPGNVVVVVVGGGQSATHS
jgi:hypothetical protein